MAAMVLVHGAWHGAWCWSGFADRLTAAGHRVRALDLRGHGGDRRPGRLWHRIRHYVDDVAAACAGLDETPVLVGHSMGGLVVQKYLEEHAAAGAVLLAPPPARGAAAATVRIARRHPLAFLQAVAGLRLGPVVGTRELARDVLFTPTTPEDVLDRAFPMLQDESLPAYLGMVVLALPRPDQVALPVLVLAGERDRIFSVAEVRATAQAYGTEAVVLPGMGHDLMLDEGWSGVVDRVVAWVDDLPTGGTGRG